MLSKVRQCANDAKPQRKEMTQRGEHFQGSELQKTKDLLSLAHSLCTLHENDPLSHRHLKLICPRSICLFRLFSVPLFSHGEISDKTNAIPKESTALA